MVKEKLKGLLTEYNEGIKELSQYELEHLDFLHEGKKHEAMIVGNKADVLAKELDFKFDEIMEFIEENV